MPRTFGDQRNHFVLQHAPAENSRAAFWSVVRAGHGKPVTGDAFGRDTYPGHEILLCLQGRSLVRTEGVQWEVHPGEAIWVNCYHPHRYSADRQDPWEYYWLRAEGPGLDVSWRTLLEAGGPVVRGCDGREKRGVFERVFTLLRERPPALDALLHAELARLVALLLHALHTTGRPPAQQAPDGIRPALERMRLYFHLPLRLSELAALCGLSVPAFTRAFRVALGTSPIDWLRRERITQAKRRLLDSEDTIKEIARQCGYGDQFYFSRDFNRMADCTPTEFRAHRK
jgi:AraC family transcriptional regulator, arabinose operon regulatory protein